MIRWHRRGCRHYYPLSLAADLNRGRWSLVELNAYIRYCVPDDRLRPVPPQPDGAYSVPSSPIEEARR